ncbi:MAG: alcohol dehydrogenase catalytic domain-containing protein [Thermoproteota archaeon]
MQAVVCHGPGDYRLEEVDVPEVKQGDVLVEVGACGVCASDVKCYRGAPSLWGGEQPYVKPPVIPGHEFIGTVVELGPGTEEIGIEIGDKAIAEQILPCHNCRFCKSGKYWMCERNYVFGFQGGYDDGGFVEYMKYPAGSIIHKVPRDMADEVAVMIEPLSCAIHAVQRARIELGDVVVIAGMGPLGLCMLQVAKMKSPGKLIALDLREERLSVAESLGADIVINVSRENAVKTVKQVTGGYGCDVYIEATGHPSAITQGLEMLRKLSRMVVFGVFKEPATADWSIIGDRKELDIYGSHLGPYCYPLAIEYLYSGKVKVDKIVTQVFPLSDFKKAFEYSEKGLDGAIKVVLKPP